MNEISEKTDIIFNTLNSIWQGIVQALPSVLGAIAILIIGWLVTKIIVYIIKKALKLAKADKLDDKLNEIDLFGDKKLNFNIIKIITSIVKWSLKLIFIVIASDFIGLSIISDGIIALLQYIPQLLVAVIIFLIGVYIASFVKKSLNSLFKSLELSGGKGISQIVFLVITVFVTITALNQAGIDTTIITSNITLILGALLAAFALAVGLGARETVSDLFKAFYTRKTYELGQVIKFKDITGEIQSVNSISMTLKTNKGTLIVPIKDIVDSQVEIQDQD
jgi:hypothetical protein